MNERTRREDRERKDRNDRGPLIDDVEKRKTRIEQFERCSKHGISYPAGGNCPKCR